VGGSEGESEFVFEFVFEGGRRARNAVRVLGNKYQQWPIRRCALRFDHHRLDAFTVPREALVLGDAITRRIPRGYANVADQLPDPARSPQSSLEHELEHGLGLAHGPRLPQM
jgi:hypothetical protein